MQRKPWSIRIALWAAVCAVLLKSAMPMLASVSAQAQGRSLVEVCTVYGVAMVVLDDKGQALPDPASGQGAPHGGDTCALAALAVFAAPEPPFLALRARPRVPSVQPVSAGASPPGVDACARWVAGLKHGPPLSA